MMTSEYWCTYNFAIIKCKNKTRAYISTDRILNINLLNDYFKGGTFPSGSIEPFNIRSILNE